MSDTFNIEEDYAEWQMTGNLYVIVCAASYEIHNISLVSDATFDTLSKAAASNLSLIVPNFSADTGQWIHSIMTDALELLIKKCLVFYKAHNSFYVGDLYDMIFVNKR